jgi:hypothetical protein
MAFPGGDPPPSGAAAAFLVPGNFENFLATTPPASSDTFISDITVYRAAFGKPGSLEPPLTAHIYRAVNHQHVTIENILQQIEDSGQVPSVKGVILCDPFAGWRVKQEELAETLVASFRSTGSELQWNNLMGRAAANRPAFPEYCLALGREARPPPVFDYQAAPPSQAYQLESSYGGPPEGRIPNNVPNRSTSGMDQRFEAAARASTMHYEGGAGNASVQNTSRRREDADEYAPQATHFRGNGNRLFQGVDVAEEGERDASPPPNKIIRKSGAGFRGSEQAKKIPEKVSPADVSREQ